MADIKSFYYPCHNEKALVEKVLFVIVFFLLEPWKGENLQKRSRGKILRNELEWSGTLEKKVHSTTVTSIFHHDTDKWIVLKVSSSPYPLIKCSIRSMIDGADSCTPWPVECDMYMYFMNTPSGGGGGDPAIYGLNRYVPLWRVWFSSSLLWDRVYKSESLGIQ